MIGFVCLFCLLFRWSILHRVLLVVGWCWVLYSSGFLCVISHYLILPRVSYLVVYCLGVSAPTPKTQGLSYCIQSSTFHILSLEHRLRNPESWAYIPGLPLTSTILGKLLNLSVLWFFIRFLPNKWLCNFQMFSFNHWILCWVGICSLDLRHSFRVLWKKTFTSLGDPISIVQYLLI